MKRIDVISSGLYELRHDGRSIAVEVVAQRATDDEGRLLDRADKLVAYGLPEGRTLGQVWPSLRPIERERFDALRAAQRANDVPDDAREVAEVWAAASQLVQVVAAIETLEAEVDALNAPLREQMDANGMARDAERDALLETRNALREVVSGYLAKHGTLPKSDAADYTLGVRETRRVVVDDCTKVEPAMLSPDLKKAEEYAKREGLLPAGFAYATTKQAVVSRRGTKS
jgi:hypothetical protein